MTPARAKPAAARSVNISGATALEELHRSRRSVDSASYGILASATLNDDLSRVRHSADTIRRDSVTSESAQDPVSQLKRSAASISGAIVTGETLASLHGGLALVRVSPQADQVATRPADQASVLIPKLMRAMQKPGISKRAIFGDAPHAKVYAYSIDPTDLSRFVRESADGTRVVGHMVGGKFRRVATKAG